ncbi:GTP-binding protein Rhes-like [Schistocerca cancellata]|uniref:GTP-binding protein Rhes-like n=1 Tax=Schistocerca cancellata TaxID=274614 RepID=UPI002117E51B|nr:GTP-binding protein Rhes-like [Schistocerca cancellata]
MPGAGGRLRLPSLGTDSPSRSSSGAAGGGGGAVSQQQRVVVMGAARVGKSAIISQFLYDRWPAKYRQTVEELHRGEYELPDGAALTLDILDTAGAHQFPAMRALSIATAHAFLLVYAVDDAASWDEVRRLRQQIVEARGNGVPIVVVGNKDDLPDAERQVAREVAETTALFEWECGYVECSAKENTHIIDVFKALLAQAKVRYNLSPAVRRRRQSLPNYPTAGGHHGHAQAQGHGQQARGTRYMLKRNSCSVA